MNADLRDGFFEIQSGAIFVNGMFGEPHMDQFAGVGYSTAPYRMKAILVDGVVYIPDPAYADRTPKRERNYASYPMVRARVQPPAYAIEEEAN